MADSPLRLLFFAEAVTLAHVARPVVLAGLLHARGHAVTLACDPRYDALVGAQPWARVALHSIPGSQFVEALAKGRPLYDLATLERYVQADRALIAQFKPDVVVGDFRISLAVSARLEGVPYIAISNAYWSPSWRRPAPTPVLPMTRLLPIPIASALFSAAVPLAFALHCRPMNALRRRHGLPGVGGRLRRVYSDADHLLIADAPALFPIEPLADNETYVGPLAWSPPVPLPPWWPALPADRPCVYVTMGSSGSADALAAVVQALSALPVQVVASTAGAPLPAGLPPNVRAAAYLPGDAACRRSRLVVCNGGSLTSQQALAEGVPVLGIASNMDQFMNMQAVEAAGAGLTLRADRLAVDAIRDACRRLLESPHHAAAAARLAPRLAEAGEPAAIFEAAARRVLAPAGARALQK